MAIFELLDYIVNEVGVCCPKALPGFPQVPQGCPCSAESGWDLECLLLMESQDDLGWKET